VDLKYTLRQFAKSPGFALVAILTLALGVGANTAIFSFVNAWILRPSNFPNPGQLVVLFETEKKTGNEGPVSAPDWKDWKEKSGVFEELAAADFSTFNLTGVDEPQKIEGYNVSANFFTALGMKPALGREFTESEMTPGQGDVVILSHQFWRDRFSSDPGILGRKITMDGVATTVVGVMPENFQFIPMGPAQMFTPLAIQPEQMASRATRFLRVMGRLKAGVDVHHATAAMTGLQNSLEQAYPATNTNRGVLVRGLQDEVDRQSGNPAVKIVFAIVSFVLLMACANVANLIMARATGRRKEMAVRIAIGAGRWRLVRQLLGETLLLFLAGAAGGVLIAKAGVKWILHAIPARSLAYIPNHGQADVDWQVLAFTLGAALVTGIMFGLAPALESTRFDVNNMLKDSGGRGAASGTGSRFKKILVAGEMAMAVMVVVCAALLVNSFVRIMGINLGFDGGRVLVGDVQLPSKYKTPASKAQFYDAVVERLASLPGVERASAATATPFDDRGGMYYPVLFVEGQPEPPAGQGAGARVNFVMPGYLESMSIPLASGRTISREDSADTTPAVVINETIARRFFAGENPIGKRIRLSRKTPPAWYTIVGVAKDIRYYEFEGPPENQAYLAFAQEPKSQLSLVVRTRGDPWAVAQSIRSVVLSVDPNQPVSSVTTVATHLDDQLAGQRILTQLTGLFGALALFLAAIGIYAVMAYSVSQRTREIGIRMALGAGHGSVLKLVVRQGMTMVLGGLLAGIAGAMVMAKALATFLYGIKPTDPATFIGSFVVLTAVALLACWIPAVRAARVDPVIALRSE
jgi:putative ABC transport system permease protein